LLAVLEKQLATIIAWDIEKWHASQKKLGKSGSKINGYVNTLKGALSRAVEWGMIDSYDLHTVKSLKVDNTIVRYLMKQEESNLRQTLSECDCRVRGGENGNLFRQQRNYPLLTPLRMNQSKTLKKFGIT